MLELSERHVEALAEVGNVVSQGVLGSVANRSHEIRTPMTESLRRSSRELRLEVTGMLRNGADEAGLRPQARIEGELSAGITSDPTRLRQILLNLIDNTPRFTARGGVDLVLSYEEDRESGGLLRMDVIDTGIGMNEERIQRAFSPFTQVDNSTTRRFRGTGLGRTIGRRLAQATGEDIEPESDGAGGGTLRASLATGATQGAPLISCLSRGEAGTQCEVGRSSISLSGCRVLLAEDDAVNQKLILKILELAGIEAHLAADGREALNAALGARDGQRPFHVVLMDMQMPVMDGYETTRVLRQQGYEGAIIALTAHALAADRERCLAAGCNGYEVKPVRRDLLLKTLQAYFDGGLRDAA